MLEMAVAGMAHNRRNGYKYGGFEFFENEFGEMLTEDKTKRLGRVLDCTDPVGPIEVLVVFMRPEPNTELLRSIWSAPGWTSLPQATVTSGSYWISSDGKWIALSRESDKYYCGGTHAGKRGWSDGRVLLRLRNCPTPVKTA